MDFRFPGHENTPIQNGLPEGWKKELIDDVLEIKCGKILPISKISKSGEYPVYGSNRVIGYYNEKNCNEIAPLITSRGNGTGFNYVIR